MMERELRLHIFILSANTVPHLVLCPPVVQSAFWHASPQYREVLHCGQTLNSFMQRRKLKLKAKFECGECNLTFKSIDQGAFNTGFIGSTCIALPLYVPQPRTRRCSSNYPPPVRLCETS
jgi:hypothetical protein